MDDATSPPIDHTTTVKALREAFADALAADTIDLLTNEGNGGDDIALAAEEWTLYLQGWPGPQVAFLAVEDEPEDGADAETIEAAWREVVSNEDLADLRKADEALRGAVITALRGSSDALSDSLADALGA